MRYNPNPKIGLTKEQINQRKETKLVNLDTTPKTKTIPQIIKGHLFTYFNFLNILLGSSIIIAGLIGNRFLDSLKNCLFMGVIFINTIISIIQEIRSKQIIDKLSVLKENKVTVIREGKKEQIKPDEIVLDDIIFLATGNQNVTDSIIQEGEVEVNEAFITGEIEPILKKQGDMLLSGSFIVSGNCLSKVEHIKEDNYIAKISKDAKYIKKSNSVILESFTKLLKILSIIIIPIGIILFIQQMIISNYDITTSTFATVAALIGMIPEGLVLLTSSVMAVSIIRLSKYKVLVQQLYCIETLARVDVICLDKTGTITEGKMELFDIISRDSDLKTIEKTLKKLTSAISDENTTINAIREKYYQSTKITTKIIPFSSKRKFSAALIDNEAIYLGAPESLLKDEYKKEEQLIKPYQEKYRVLLLAKSKTLSKNPSQLEIMGYLLIRDKIRKEAKKTINYFKEQNIKVKIISGDNLTTVTNIAEMADLHDLKGIDFNSLKDDEILEATKEYDIFARVTPEGKKKIITALKQQGHTVAMTGDGVNDVLALKEADCSVAVASGSEAARNVSEIVLLDSNFDSMPKVILEGRRTINNIERSSSLLLVKTIFTLILIIVCILTSTTYYFIPIQLTLITFFTIGSPSFFLALEPNNELVTGNFLLKVIGKSIPAALTIALNVSFIMNLKEVLKLSGSQASTISVLLTATTGFIFLYKICKPFTKYRLMLYIILLSGFIYASTIHYKFFNIITLNKKTLIIYLISVLITIIVYNIINKIVQKILNNITTRSKN